MANVRHTAKHIYSIEDRLGQGATCNVFKGLSKDNDFHALKIFEPYARKDIDRETAALQRLKHENIIQFIGVENETATRQVVVVMEFCEGGSLASYLQEPDNTFGLPDTEFLLLLKHLTSGMQHLRSHGFVHRDIKPGNILRCINEDGLSLFKLSDFGTARPLEDDEYFKSLVGTEEYLHPELFSAAFMNQTKSLRFPHSVDLWSVAATLYNAATGDVPFCPYHRRQDKDTMYEMITKKPAGVIGARQERPKGEIQWLYGMPDTCQLSGGLQQLLVPVLVCLFERDQSRMWTFEQLFTEVQTILSLEAISILAVFPHHSPFDALYLPQFDTVSQLKENLGERWSGTDRKLAFTFYGETRLSDWLHDEDQLFDLPPTDQASPIVSLPAVLPVDVDVATSELSMSKIVSEELTFSGSLTYSEVLVGRAMCGAVALVDRRAKALSVFQQHLLKLRHRLRFHLRSEMQEAEKTFHLLSELFDVINGSADKTTWSQQDRNNFEAVKVKMASVNEKLQKSVRTVKLPFEDNQWNFDGLKCMQQTGRAKEEALSWLRNIKEHRKASSRNRSGDQYAEKCIKACREKLEVVYKRAVSLWSEQCFQKMALLRTSFLDWYRSYLEAMGGLQICQEELSHTVTLISHLFKTCVNQSHSPTSVSQKVSKSLLATDSSRVVRSQILDLKNMLHELTNDLEVPEVFGVPSINGSRHTPS